MALHDNNIKQEAHLSPRDPRDALHQLKYWPTVVQMTQADHVLTWWAPWTTATFYGATCIVLYTHRCSRHNYRTQCRTCHQQTFAQPILLMSTGP